MPTKRWVRLSDSFCVKLSSVAICLSQSLSVDQARAVQMTVHRSSTASSLATTRKDQDHSIYFQPVEAESYLQSFHALLYKVQPLFRHSLSPQPSYLIRLPFSDFFRSLCIYFSSPFAFFESSRPFSFGRFLAWRESRSRRKALGRL